MDDGGTKRVALGYARAGRGPQGGHGRGLDLSPRRKRAPRVELRPGGLLRIKRLEGADGVKQAHGLRRERSTRAVVSRRVGLGRGGRRSRCQPAAIRSSVRHDDGRGPERARAPLDGFKAQHFAELCLVLGQGRDGAGGAFGQRLAGRRVKGGRHVPAGQVRAGGGQFPLGRGGVERRALLNVLHALAELPRGAVAGDPLGLT